MSRVLLPEGTAPSRIFRELILRARRDRRRSFRWRLRAKFKNSEDLAQNGWFVGFTPRRNPDIVVCVLFQGGEHGRLAARLATQVIKAYVDKQRRNPQKMVEKPKSNGNGGYRRPVDSARFRTATKMRSEAARFVLDLPKKPLVLATAAPGMTDADDCCIREARTALGRAIRRGR